MIAIIPARKGSKRLPNKNITFLGSNRLIDWTVEAAKKSECFETIIISTDCPEIKNLYKYDFEITIHNRPVHLAGDLASSEDVIKDVIINSEKNIQNQANSFMLLQPTSPLRTSDQIIETCTFHQSNSYVGVVSSVKHKNNENKFLMIHARDQKNFVPNGAIYLSSISSFLTSGSFYSSTFYSYSMCKKTSVDIDTIDDFNLAKSFLQKGNT